MGLFVRIRPKQILFMSFGGQGFSDSPKAIYDYLRNYDGPSLKLIWAFQEPQSVSAVPPDQKVKIDTFTFFITALRAQAWVTNSSIERGLNFKKRKTIYFNTWHGTPLKKMGKDIANNQSFDSKASFGRVDKFTVQSDYERDIFARAFGIDQRKLFKIGLPRNDELVLPRSSDKYLRKRFGFTNHDIIILYAPTFREFDYNTAHQITSRADILMAKLVEELPANYKILSRSHYEVDIVSHGKRQSNRIVDVSDYPNLNELIHLSDMLISDYSSIIFDYSLTEKPIFIYAYDYEEYNKKRGLYFDIETELLSSRDIKDLSQSIQHDQDLAQQYVKAFKTKYLDYYGQATKLSCDYLVAAIKAKNESGRK